MAEDQKDTKATSGVYGAFPESAKCPPSTLTADALQVFQEQVVENEALVIALQCRRSELEAELQLVETTLWRAMQAQRALRTLPKPAYGTPATLGDFLQDAQFRVVDAHEDPTE